jgi:hypothetical protein
MCHSHDASRCHSNGTLFRPAKVLRFMYFFIILPDEAVFIAGFKERFKFMQSIFLAI